MKKNSNAVSLSIFSVVLLIKIWVLFPGLHQRSIYITKVRILIEKYVFMFYLFFCLCWWSLTCSLFEKFGAITWFFVVGSNFFVTCATRLSSHACMSSANFIWYYIEKEMFFGTPRVWLILFNLEIYIKLTDIWYFKFNPTLCQYGYAIQKLYLVESMKMFPFVGIKSKWK